MNTWLAGPTMGVGGRCLTSITMCGGGGKSAEREGGGGHSRRTSIAGNDRFPASL